MCPTCVPAVGPQLSTLAVFTPYALPRTTHFYFTSFSLPAARLGVFMLNFTVSRQNSPAIVAASRPE